MAQQDTGLGWSAESDWLTGAAASMGTLSKIGGTIVNYGLGSSDFANGTVIDSGSGTSQRVCVATVPDSVSAFYVSPSSFIFVSSDTNVTIWVGNKGGTTYGGWSPTNRDTATGFYYVNVGLGGMTAPILLPTYSSLREGLDAIFAASSNTTFYKDIARPAVGCWCKWYTGGSTIFSPILISSQRDYVQMSCDDSSQYFAVASKLFGGINFYMGFFQNVGGSAATTLQIPDLTDKGALDIDTVFSYLISTSYAHVIVINPPDPYETLGQESEEEGGDGEETDDDPVGDSVHTIPSGGAFYRIFSPTLSQLQDLAYYMWGPLDLDNIKRLYANPMDSILGLGIVPLNLTGANASVYIGGVDTGLSFPLISNEVYQVPFGYIDIAPRWGCYLDYEPYTKLTIYLPFIGYKELNTDEFMGKQLILNYSIDIVTGACVARISVSGGSVMYQFSGQCLKQLPVTSGNWDNALRTAVSSAVALGATIATQGATAPVLADAVASASVQALTMKPNIEKSGNLSGMAGMMGIYRPFLLRSQPIQVIPGNQNKFIGYPSFVTKTLNDITGYNEISSIHLEGIPATGDELDEIESLLKGGVIL